MLGRKPFRYRADKIWIQQQQPQQSFFCADGSQMPLRAGIHLADSILRLPHNLRQLPVFLLFSLFFHRIIDLLKDGILRNSKFRGQFTGIHVPLNGAAETGQQIRSFPQIGHLTVRRTQHMATPQLHQLVFHVVCRAFQQQTKPFRSVFLDEFIGILPIRNGHDPDMYTIAPQ